MGVDKVNCVNANPLKRFLNCLLHIFWVTTKAVPIANGSGRELGCQKDLISFSRSRKPGNASIIATTP